MRANERIIDAEKNSKTKAMVKGKLEKVLDAQVLLRSAFLNDLPTPAKVSSLVTQKQDPHIIEAVKGVEKNKRNHKRLLKKVQRDSNQVYELPTLKSVIQVIEEESDDDDEMDDPVYQGQRLKYYRRGKQYIACHCADLLVRIIACYYDRYWFDDTNTNTSKHRTIILYSQSLKH